MGTGLFPGVKRHGRGVDDTITPNRKSTAIPLIPLWAFVDCSRVNWASFTRDKDTGNLKLIAVHHVYRLR
jgi:hypothetical protein